MFIVYLHRNYCKSDQMPHSVAFELGLHCLHHNPKGVADPKRGSWSEKG